MSSLADLLALLGNVPDNEFRLRELTRQVRTEASVIPFIGAGLSTPYGFPAWTPFLIGLAQRVGRDAEIRQRLDQGQYEEVAEDLRQALGQLNFDDHVAEAFGNDKLGSVAALKGAVAHVPAIANHAIVTTNFDQVVERAFRESGADIRPVWGADAARDGARALQHDESVLLKLHGDFSTSSGRILTLAEYKNHYGGTKAGEVDLNLPIPSLLFSMLATRSLLFLGCSLATDRTVQMLLSVAARFPGNAHYALMSMPSEGKELYAKSLKLSNMGVRPIWYPANCHERIEDVLAHLAAERRLRQRSREPINTAAPSSVGNVPAAASELVGRCTELAQLDGISDACRLVTIAGAPGMGKTALALALARRQQSRFPEGVWFVELDSLRESGLVAQRVANVLGLREQSQEPPQESLALHLASKSIVLVLDNAEHVADACAHTAEFLIGRCPNLRIVVTSRSILKANGEFVYQLWPLKAPRELATRAADLEGAEAVTLLIARARANGSKLEVTDDNASSIAALCRALDGIPLAIELAAARLRSLSVEEVSARLSKDVNFLRDSKQGAGRHWQTLTAAMNWSHELLEPNQRVILRRLSVFDGGWNLAAAQAVCFDDDSAADAALDMLETLQDQSLVVHTEHSGVTRFRLLEPIRQYALQQLHTAGEADSIQSRHAQWYVRVVENAAPKLVGADAAKWLDALTADADNLRAAMRWTIDHGDGESALRLTGGLWRFCEIRGHFREGRERLTKALALRGSEQLGAVRARALSGAGMLAYRQGDYERAQPLFEEALELERRGDNQIGVANALNDLGIVAQRRVEFEPARALFDECLAIQRTLKDGRGIGAALFNLGNVEFQSGQLEAARSLLTDSVRTFIEVGAERDRAFPLNVLALVAIRQGEFDLALQHATKSLEIRKQYGDKRGIAETLRTSALLRLQMKQYAEATEGLIESMKLATGVGDLRGTAETLELFGLRSLRIGNAASAVRFYGAAAAIRTNERIVAMPFELELSTDALQRAKAELGDQRYSRWWNDGYAWPASELNQLLTNDSLSPGTAQQAKATESPRTTDRSV